MKKAFNIIFLVILSVNISRGQIQKISADSVALYFEEVKQATKNFKKLWDIDLYGPIIVVDPYSREAYSNSPDTAGVLKKVGSIYTGKLPGHILLGNYSLDWGGVKWAMILTIFINKIKDDRIDLFSHELFHRVQPLLNFKRINELGNQHLDSKQGRIFLRLELEALKLALLSPDKKQKNNHVTNAFIFRNQRYKLFPGAYTSEAIIEINEGIASYTGKVVRGLKNTAIGILMKNKIDSFFKERSYIQLFAYNTIPAYGFLLRESDTYWNKKVTSETNLTDFFISAFHVQTKISAPINIDSISNLYNGDAISREETEREIRNKKIVDAYKAKFLEQPNFEISFEKKRISYDTRYIVTIEDLGVVYPTMKATDNWGVLDITDVGGLLNQEKSKMIITAPLKFDGNKISGEGWILQLNEGYIVERDSKTGNFKLKKRLLNE
ncbi:MAG TPA: hypothetical protein VFN30_14335 [Chitinophagaceae bacterium]|nr:hypothetical protein [Chitinophagaceae bacterium]